MEILGVLTPQEKEEYDCTRGYTEEFYENLTYYQKEKFTFLDKRMCRDEESKPSMAYCGHRHCFCAADFKRDYKTNWMEMFWKKRAYAYSLTNDPYNPFKMFGCL